MKLYVACNALKWCYPSECLSPKSPTLIEDLRMHSWKKGWISHKITVCLFFLLTYHLNDSELTEEFRFTRKIRLSNSTSKSPEQVYSVFRSSLLISLNCVQLSYCVVWMVVEVQATVTKRRRGTTALVTWSTCRRQKHNIMSCCSRMTLSSSYYFQ